MKLFTLFFMAAVILQAQTPVFIRVSNSSQYDFTNIEIYSPVTGFVHFDTLKSNENSAYRKFTKAYAIAAATVEIANEKIKFLPDDYLGELMLKPGRYTYQLNVTEKKGMKYLRLQLIIEGE